VELRNRELRRATGGHADSPPTVSAVDDSSRRLPDKINCKREQKEDPKAHPEAEKAKMKSL
jgi:hypothetical protein